MQYNTAEFRRQERSNYNCSYTDGALTITKADQTIIKATAPASAANNEIFTVMVAFFQILNASNIR